MASSLKFKRGMLGDNHLEPLLLFCIILANVPGGGLNGGWRPDGGWHPPHGRLHWISRQMLLISQDHRGSEPGAPTLTTTICNPKNHHASL